MPIIGQNRSGDRPAYWEIWSASVKKEGERSEPSREGFLPLQNSLG